MAKLDTQFFGLSLKTPIIIGSSGLSSSVEKIKQFEENGAGAVVLKSIFEEEIYYAYQEELKKQLIGHHNLEHLDYFDYEIKTDQIQKYLTLIKDAKKQGVSIPIVASINCSSSNDWIFFAKKLEEAGADAIELNMFVLPTDIERSSEEVHYYYYSIIRKVVGSVSIPVSVKLSPYFSDLAGVLRDISEMGIAGITLFNRTYNIDIDINNKELVPAMILSHQFEYLQSLRWVGIMDKIVSCELSASTGIHDVETVIKLIMAGASATQVVSGVYKNGFGFVKELVVKLSEWMDENGFESIEELKGAANSINVKNPAWYERVQFMKYFGEYDQ